MVFGLAIGLGALQGGSDRLGVKFIRRPRCQDAGPFGVDGEDTAGNARAFHFRLNGVITQREIRGYQQRALGCNIADVVQFRLDLHGLLRIGVDVLASRQNRQEQIRLPCVRHEHARILAHIRAGIQGRRRGVITASHRKDRAAQQAELAVQRRSAGLRQERQHLGGGHVTR